MRIAPIWYARLAAVGAVLLFSGAVTTALAFPIAWRGGPDTIIEWIVLLAFMLVSAGRFAWIAWRGWCYRA